MVSPRLAVSLLAVVAAALLAGCSAGDPRSCSVLCGAASECPDGLSCGPDNYCYLADETPGSCTAGSPDASIVDASILPVDAGEFDAAPTPDAQPESDADPCAGRTSVTGEISPALAIPDDNAAGVESAIVIDEPCAQVETVQVWLDITHPFRGDLDAFLIAPNGQVLDIFNDSNDSSDNYHAAFDLVLTPGFPASGEWVLNVADLNGLDVGTLDRWSIGVNEDAPPPPP